jgi:hypothetical protein
MLISRKPLDTHSAKCCNSMDNQKPRGKSCFINRLFNLIQSVRDANITMSTWRARQSAHGFGSHQDRIGKIWAIMGGESGKENQTSYSLWLSITFSLSIRPNSGDLTNEWWMSDGMPYLRVARFLCCLERERSSPCFSWFCFVDWAKAPWYEINVLWISDQQSIHCSAEVREVSKYYHSLPPIGILNSNFPCQKMLSLGMLAAFSDP